MGRGLRGCLWVRVYEVVYDLMMDEFCISLPPFINK